MYEYKNAMAEQIKRQYHILGVFSQLKRNNFHNLHRCHLTQKQLSLEGSQPLRENILRSRMIHKLTLRETVKNKISQEIKRKTLTEKETGQNS